MLRLAGVVLLMAGAAGLGLGAAGQLRRRVESLRTLTGALEQAERELSFRLTPMPELMERLARQAGEPARFLFAHCRDHLWELGEKSFGELWREALEGESDLLLGDREREVLSGLGDVLGRYDAAGQREALQAAGRAGAAPAPGGGGPGPAGPGLHRPGPGLRGHAGPDALINRLRGCGKRMDIDLIFRIAAIGILVSVLNQVLSRSGREEQATMTTLAGLVVVLMMVVQEISDLFNLVKDLFGL